MVSLSCSVQQAALSTGFHYFLYQAEDGIRDLVRSRGLGDVYKRQVGNRLVLQRTLAALVAYRAVERMVREQKLEDAVPVSYTHLTLPTSDLV